MCIKEGIGEEALRGDSDVGDAEVEQENEDEEWDSDEWVWVCSWEDDFQEGIERIKGVLGDLE